MNRQGLPKRRGKPRVWCEPRRKSANVYAYLWNGKGSPSAIERDQTYMGQSSPTFLDARTPICHMQRHFCYPFTLQSYFLRLRCVLVPSANYLHQQSRRQVPHGTWWYAKVPGSRITSRQPSSQIWVFTTIFCAVFVVRDGTRVSVWQALVRFADAGCTKHQQNSRVSVASSDQP